MTVNMLLSTLEYPCLIYTAVSMISQSLAPLFLSTGAPWTGRLGSRPDPPHRPTRQGSYTAARQALLACLACKDCTQHCTQSPAAAAGNPPGSCSTASRPARLGSSCAAVGAPAAVAESAWAVEGSSSAALGATGMAQRHKAATGLGAQAAAAPAASCSTARAASDECMGRPGQGLAAAVPACAAKVPAEV